MSEMKKRYGLEGDAREVVRFLQTGKKDFDLGRERKVSMKIYVPAEGPEHPNPPQHPPSKSPRFLSKAQNIQHVLQV